MTITNIGYDGTVNDIGFAQMQQHAGNLVPVVCGRLDFAVTVNSSATRTCNVAVGSAYAPGVLSTSDAVVSAVFDIVSTAGQTRWDAVVLRRNWSTGTETTGTTVVVVKGTAAVSAPQVLPAGVDQVLDSGVDQVLALVQITNGEPLPTAVVDRRIQASKVFTVPSTAALPTASNALYGMEAVAAGVRYRCGLVAGSPTWVQTGAPTVVTAGGFGSSVTGFTTTGLNNRYTVSADGTEVQYDLSIRRSGASIQAGAAGDMADTLVFNLTTGIKPDQSLPVTFSARGGATATSSGSATFFGYLTAAGALYVSNGMPNTWLTTQTTGPSLSACIKFTKGA